MIVQIVEENGQKKIIPLTADAGAGNPVGTIIPMYKKSNPSGYLYCDGSTFDQNAYPLLFAYLGTNVLPDYREFALVGAEENTTDVYDEISGEGTIHTHDVYTEGEAKDDVLQKITGTFTVAPINGTNSGSSGAFGFKDHNTANWYSGSSSTYKNHDFDSSRVTRNDPNADVTRGKRKAVFFYIKATSGLSENAQDDVISTLSEQLKEQRSYSTTEHFTGEYWIDGKPIYEKTFMNSWGSSGGTQRVNIDLTDISIDSIVKGEGMMDGNSSLGRGFYPMTFIRASSSGTANAFSWGIDQTKSTLFFVIQGDGLSTKMFECTFTLKYTKAAS